MDYSQHPKEIAGISDMKELAELIGDLHYKTLADLMAYFSFKLSKDGRADYDNGRISSGANLIHASNSIGMARDYIQEAWQISKTFMESKNQ